MTSEKLSLENLNHEELIRSSTGEKLSLSASISDHFQFKDVLVHHEILKPGRSASGSHSHTHREEMIFVIDGYPTVYLKGQKQRLRPGDAFGFSPSSDNFHYLANETETNIQLLVIASNPSNDQVIYEKLD